MARLDKQDLEFRMDRFELKIMSIRSKYCDMMRNDMMNIDEYQQNSEIFKGGWLEVEPV